MRQSFLAAAVILAASAAPTVLGADWAQWRGPARTGHAPADEKVPAAIPAEPKVLWRNKVGDGFASPVVAGKHLVYLDHQAGKEVVHCVNADDGKELWAVELFEAFKDGFGIGPRCTPVIEGQVVYAQSCKGELQCLNLADGKQVWRKNFVTDFGATFIGEKGTAAGAQRHGNNGSPLVDGDRLIVNAGGAKDASVVCLDRKTGATIWSSQKDLAGYAPPVIATIHGIKQVIDFTADGAIGLNAADGALLWRVPVKTQYARHVTTPVVFGDMVVVASHAVGTLGIKINKTASGLEAVTAWTSKDIAMNFASPVEVDGQLYGLGPKKNVFCAAIDTGIARWSKDALILSSADKAHASFLVLGKTILLLNDSGQLIQFSADPAAYKELGRAQVCGSNWCNPAYASGRLYIKDNKELLAVQLLD